MTAANSNAVRVRGAVKRYAATTALKGVDLDVAAGTVHALVGENGAGKSSLLGILAGRVRPSAGEVSVFGGDLPFGDPHGSRRAGIAAIYQELTIVPARSAMENVFLGAPRSRLGWIAERAMLRRYRELGERLGVEIDPRARAGELSVAQQQQLEIMRALNVDARLILFDEPTAALGATERDALLGLMRELGREGVTMLFVSHDLDEVLEVSDRVTVFRDGVVRAERDAKDWTRGDLVSAMLGESAAALAAGAFGSAAATAAGDRRADSARARARKEDVPLLDLEGLTVPGSLSDVSLRFWPGEIVGIAGLVGSGRSTLLRALAGLERKASGSLTLEDRAIGVPRSVRAALAQGIAFVPEDRKDEGLVLGLPTMVNVTLPALDQVSTAGWRRPAAVRRRAEAATAPFGLDPRRLTDPVGDLSGGNQQKALLARWMFRRPKVLLADEPTRGIDVGAKAQILDSLRSFTEDGAAVLMVSPDQEELLAAADRIFVLARGRVTAELDNTTRSVDEQTILDAAFDLEEPHARR